jgi:adenine deaminase
MPQLGLQDFLRALPKVELHCHLTGTVRKETFTRMAERARAPLTAAAIDAFYTRGAKPVNVSHVLRAVDRHLIKRTDDLHEMTIEYLEDAASHGVRYSEFFWVPTGTVAVSGIPYELAQAAILRAIADAQAQFGIIGRLIPSIDRQASPAAALEMVEWVVHHRQPEVVGIGIEFEEVGRPPELFAEAFMAARRAGLKTTAHAGENGVSWKNIETAIDLLGVDRIDHGYSVIDNPELARRCADRGILFTVIPSNSYLLRTLPPERWALDHPIRRMPGMGLRVHPNTDNPTLHNVTPTRAWMMMMNDFGFGVDDLRDFMHHGLDGAWIDETQRRQWRTQWSLTFDELRAQLDPSRTRATAVNTISPNS